MAEIHGRTLDREDIGPIDRFEKILVQMVHHVVGWICESVVFRSVNGKEYFFISKIVTWWNSQKKILMQIYFLILKTLKYRLVFIRQVA